MGGRPGLPSLRAAEGPGPGPHSPQPASEPRASSNADIAEQDWIAALCLWHCTAWFPSPLSRSLSLSHSLSLSRSLALSLSLPPSLPTYLSIDLSATLPLATAPCRMRKVGKATAEPGAGIYPSLARRSGWGCNSWRSPERVSGSSSLWADGKLGVEALVCPVLVNFQLCYNF